MYRIFYKEKNVFLKKIKPDRPIRTPGVPHRKTPRLHPKTPHTKKEA
jgi:hypothetical protein